MLTSRHQKIKNLMTTAMNDERKLRKIEKDADSAFLGWKVNQETGLEHTKGTGSLTARAYRASLKLGIEIQEKEELTGKTLELTCEERTVEVKNQSSANTALLEPMRNKWQKDLKTPSFHLHSFNSLVNNKESNAFVIRLENSVKDSFLKFALKARTNTLPTKEFVEIIQNRPHTPCSKCNRGTNESLQHILNGCPANVGLIMERHNRIVRYLRDEIRELRPEYTYAATDATIREVILEENRNLKPDIQVWNAERDQAIIVEVNVPYAKEWEGKDSLQEKYEIKVDKYRDLIRELQARGVTVEFYAIIVSSLGALYKETQRAIYQLFRNHKKSRTICRMISSMAISGSAKIWYENRRGGDDRPEIMDKDEANDSETEQMSGLEDADIEETERELAQSSTEHQEEEEQERQDDSEEDETMTDEDLEHMYKDSESIENNELIDRLFQSSSDDSESL